jgi:hypothetical protein
MRRMRLSIDTAPHVVPAVVPELRREQRLYTLFRTGKLVSEAGETICRVRNISPNGFMADVCAAPRPGAAVALELCEGQTHAAEVMWAQGDRFGAQFLEASPLADLLAHASHSPHQRHRAPRVVPRSGFATVIHAGKASRASIVNISQTGMAVFAYDLVLSAATPRSVDIEIDGLDPIKGMLCWAAHGAAGIQFERPLSFETLSHWLWSTSIAAAVEVAH